LCTNIDQLTFQCGSSRDCQREIISYYYFFGKFIVFLGLDG